MKKYNSLEYSLLFSTILSLFLICLQLRDVFKYDAKISKDITAKIFNKTIVNDKIVHWAKIENTEYYLVITDREVYRTKSIKDLVN